MINKRVYTGTTTVTATSVFDNTKSTSCTVNVTPPQPFSYVDSTGRQNQIEAGSFTESASDTIVWKNDKWYVVAESITINDPIEIEEKL